MTAASAALRAEMAANITVLRAIPVDDQERARLIADRIKGITGCQCGEDDCWQCRVNCWLCRTDMAPSDVQPDGRFFACKDEDDCNRRAAEFAETEGAERFYGAMAEYEDEFQKLAALADEARAVIQHGPRGETS